MAGKSVQLPADRPVETIDVAIVGSGPAGISTALHLVQRDPAWAGRMVVIDKAIHPRDKLCGGGVTHLGQNVLARLGLSLEPTNFPVHEVRLLYGKQSYSFHGNPVFRIVRRAEFDHWLVRTAEAQGVVVRQGEAVVDVVEHEDFVELSTEKAIIRAKTLVVADGSRSFIRSRLKWEGVSRVARLIEVDTPENPATTEEFQKRVAVFDFTRMTSDDLQGYYWDFPSYVNGEPVMNRGVFDSRALPERPKADLRGVMAASLAERDRELAQYKIKGHPIRWWDRRNSLARPRILLAGDAAGVDPLFGEGISLALGYGDVAAATVADAFARNNFSFATYRRRLLSHWLMWQLPWRTRLAKAAYFLNYPWLVKLGWTLARPIIRLTRWRDPSYVPAEPPRLVTFN